ncbi:MAG: hypothetical protein HFI34_05745 [Lachnospiraceae bacterium]|nr:hypothetical protein [Lachnospiraceae bacterium]
MNLYHYFDKTTGPFCNMSDLSDDEAGELLKRIRIEKPDSMCAKRQDSYVDDRRKFENILKEEFIKKGGKPVRQSPHYMVVEQCKWLESWYENSDYIKIPIEEFDVSMLSFTYGDSHPTFSDKVNDGKEYRKKLYTYEEILGIIDKYGLPQDWNADGKHGPERYVEVHVWSDETIFQTRSK